MTRIVSDTEQHEAAAARDQQGDENRVEHRPDEVAEVLQVEAVAAAEQVVEEAERKADRERERDQERRDPRLPDEIRRGLDQQRARTTRAPRRRRA